MPSEAEKIAKMGFINIINIKSILITPKKMHYTYILKSRLILNKFILQDFEMSLAILKKHTYYQINKKT